ncbi:MAG: ribosome recycling factor [Candidatus Hydrogenedentales bacterium]
MANAITREAREKMEKSLHNFQHELTQIRTGRASVGLLDAIEVDVYGSRMRINQLGTVTAPEARLLVIQPWDKSQISAIEKAIQMSPLDLNPNNDGALIRIPLPQLTEERRKDLAKFIGKLAEETRVAVRNIRRTEMDAIRKRQKDGEIPEDDAHKLSDEVQKITDEYIKKVDETLKSKEEEIMEV